MILDLLRTAIPRGLSTFKTLMINVIYYYILHELINMIISKAGHIKEHVVVFKRKGERERERERERGLKFRAAIGGLAFLL